MIPFVLNCRWYHIYNYFNFRYNLKFHLAIFTTYIKTEYSQQFRCLLCAPQAIFHSLHSEANTVTKLTVVSILLSKFLISLCIPKQHIVHFCICMNHNEQNNPEYNLLRLAYPV